MRRQVIVAALLAALALPALAVAKGPSSASISGPGLVRSLALGGDGETVGNPLGALVNASGFFPQLFGQTPDPTLKIRPRGRLGPRYAVVYVVPGPNDARSRIVQYVYPYAKPGGLTYVRPGQRFWDGRRTHGGWYRAAPGLKRLLVRMGLPAAAPS